MIQTEEMMEWWKLPLVKLPRVDDRDVHQLGLFKSVPESSDGSL